MAVDRPPGAPPPTTAATRPRRLVLDAVVVAGAAVGLAVVCLQLWAGDLSVPLVYLEPDRSPFSYAPDAPFYLMIVKGAIDHGWFLNNPSLGHPFGQALHEFPQGLDHLNLVVLQVVGWITGNAFTTVNLFYLLTFAGVAVSAYLVARRLGCSRIAGMVVAVVYAFLPYHFARGTAHLLLSAYWMVPVAALLLAQVVSPRPPFTADADTPRGWRIAWRTRSSLLWLLAGIGLASTGSYYAALTLTLVVIVVLVDVAARRNLRVLASGALVVAVILGAATVNLVPTFVYWADNGRNENLVQRGPSETEVNGLKISQLVLPVEGHRIGALAEIEADSTRFSIIPAERGQQLGALGAVGFVAILVVLLAGTRRRAVASEVPPSAGPGWDPPLTPGGVVRVFGIATVGGIVIAAISGISLIISGLGIKEIRSWNRISVFIGFFALVTVGFGIDWLRRRLPDRWWRTPATVVACGLLVGLAVLDQFSPRMVPRYDETETVFTSDRTFFGRVERTLPPGSAVLNVPYMFFPESGTIFGIGPYDSARGYLQTDGLRWSWGGVVGTEADWAAGATQGDTTEMLERAVALGFRGLVLDRRGYEDRVREDEIRRTTGDPGFTSPDGTLAFFDLRDYGRTVRARLGPDGMRALRATALADRGNPRVFG